MSKRKRQKADEDGADGARKRTKGVVDAAPQVTKTDQTVQSGEVKAVKPNSSRKKKKKDLEVSETNNVGTQPQQPSGQSELHPGQADSIPPDDAEALLDVEGGQQQVNATNGITTTNGSNPGQPEPGPHAEWKLSHLGGGYLQNLDPILSPDDGYDLLAPKYWA